MGSGGPESTDSSDYSDKPELIDTATAPTVRYRGRYLYSRTSPESSAVKRLGRVDPQPKTLIVVPSPLLFYGLGELLTSIPQECHILCIEADQKLMAFSALHMPGRLRGSQRLTFVRADSAEQIYNVVTSLGPWNFRRAVLLPLSGGYALYSGVYQSLFAAVEHSIRSSWQNKMTSIHMASLWFRNLFLNLARLRNAPRRIPDAAEGKPVLVAGAGISLEGSIGLIKKFRERIYLLSVDTALPVLELHGIIPDGICILEGQMYNQYDFLGTSSRQAAIFADATAYPPSLRLFTGPLHLFISEFAPSNLFERLRRLDLLPQLVPPLGSIGVTALYIAKRITPGPVLFTGLDFAYRVGKTHANGAPAHTALLHTASRLAPPIPYGLCINRPRLQAAAKHGKAITDLVLLSYLEPLNSVIGDDKRCYDISDFGLQNRAENIKTAADMEAVLQEKPEYRESGSQRGNNGPETDPHGDAVRRFFEEELTILDGAVRQGTHFITTDQSRRGTDSTLTALSAVDYVYLHFPDPPPLPKNDVGFVKRSVISARKYRDFAANCLKNIKGRKL